VLPSVSCHWLHGALSPSEQAALFEFVKGRDQTDWANLPVCMNPTPKTLQLAHGDGALGPTLAFDLSDFDDETDVATVAVRRVAEILRSHGCSMYGDRFRNNDAEQVAPVSFSLAAIRYNSPDGTFPRHVDHCNDGSAVFLFSLGCAARFRVDAKMLLEGQHVAAPSSSRDLELLSGDVLAFDPSSRAAIGHAVNGISGAETCPAELVKRFDGELRHYRYGIQCRVRFGRREVPSSLGVKPHEAESATYL